MDSSFRNVRRVVDSLLARSGRVASGVVFVVLVAFCCGAPRVVHASSNPSFDAAWASCQQYAASYHNSAYWNFDHCGLGADGKSVSGYCRRLSDGYIATCGPGWYFDGVAPASNPCTTIASVSIYLDGKVSNGFTLTQTATDPYTGATVQCAMTVSVQGAPVWNPWSSKWQTFATLTPTGTAADTAGVKDGSGSPVPDVVNPGTYANQSTAPSVCSTGSCYNAATDKYSASTNGSLSFIGGDTARSSAGGCSGGSAVLCAGSPTPPLPTPAQVRDPATDIVSSDKYTQADPTTGATLPVVVNIYRAPLSTSTPTSGQQSGDSGPAPASTSSGPSSSYAGGGDCNTPPVCSGDAATCGAARTQWATTCQLHKDLAGTGAPSDFDSLKTKYAQSDVWTDASATTDGSVGGQANAGNYDMSGFGWSTSCPLQDIVVPMGSLGTFSIPVHDKCYVGSWLRALVIGSALIAAAIITAGGRGGM